MNLAGEANLVVSNRLEVLADELKSRLFSPGSQPFERRLIIVPSRKIRSFLLQSFAADPCLGIAAGMQIQTINKIVNHPSAEELSIRLEYEIHLLSSTDAVFAPLFAYLEDNRRSLRLPQLCDQLSRLFIRYGIYGSPFLKSWLQKEGWQQALWQRIFKGDVGFAIFARTEKSIHLFGFHFLPKLYQAYFLEQGAQFYLLSPCRYFWSDFCTDRQKVNLKKRFGAEAQEFLQDQNPLLANLGRVSREFIKYFEMQEINVDERYVDNESDSGLHTVQNDLLDECKTALQDDSIQVHAASSKLREVEILLEVLRDLADREQIEPKEIVVLAPDISEYAPYIHWVFGLEKSDFDYTISELEVASQSHLVQGLEHLLTLPTENFSVTAVLELFTFSSFLEKFSLTAQDVNSIRAWIQKTHIRFGLDSAHRQQLGMLETSSVGTWEHGLDRLLLGLAYINEGGENEYLSCVEWSEIELLGKLIEIIRGLSEDLKPILEKRTLSIEAWLKFIRTLTERYFNVTDTDARILEGLRQFAITMRDLNKPVFKFAAVAKIVKSFFSAKSAFYHEHHLQAIRFGSISPGCAVPAKVICLLGMDENQFPRFEKRSSLNEMEQEASIDYHPSRNEEDRTLFLELLLSARRAFILIYQRIHPEDHKEQNGSPIVQELFSYLQKRHGWETDKMVKIHPALPFDKSYFATPSHISHGHFLAAKAYYQSLEKNSSLVIPEFYIPKALTEGAREKEWVVSIRQLRNLAKHPIKFYFQNVLKIYLKDEEENEDEFVLSYLDQARLRRASLQQPLEEIIKSATASGLLPIGPFKEVAIQRLKEEIETYRAHLDAFAITPDQIFTLEFKLGCDKPYQLRENWIVAPALTISLNEGCSAIVTGVLEDLSPQGMLFHAESKFEGALQAWPLLLLLHHLPEYGKKCLPQILYTKDGKTRADVCQNPSQALRDYFEYYELARANVSPLMSGWGKALLQGEPADLKEALRTASKAHHPDLYLERVFARDAQPDTELIFSTWAPRLRALFSSLCGKGESV